MRLGGLPVVVEGAPTSMPDAVLTEIAALLQRLLEDGLSGAIDLRSLPLSAGDRDRLERQLGHGEVRAFLDVAGATEIHETGYAGVWWVRHLDGSGRLATEQIAVTRVPDILISPPDDIRDAAARLVAKTQFAAATCGDPEPLHD